MVQVIVGRPLESARLENRVIAAVVAVLMVFLAWQAYLVWGDSDTAVTHFPQALQILTPNRPVTDYLTITPAVLNARQPGLDFAVDQRVHYVGPNVASEGPFEVSVHVIDRYDLGAVARGDNGDCYATLLSLQPNHPQYGGTTYANLGRRSRCLGELATPATVTSQNEPQ